MLDDLFSSARGPGIIGLLLAVVVLAFLSVIAVSAYTSSDGSAQLAKTISDQKLQIGDLTNEIDGLKKGQETMAAYQEGHVELKTLTKQLSELKDSHAALVAQSEARESKIGDLETDFADYRVRYRENEREGAVGEVVDLSSTHGDDYKEAKITRVNAAEIGVMVESGPKRIGFEELPPEMQDRFQFSKEEAEDYAAEVEGRERDRDKAIAAGLQRAAADRAEWEAKEFEKEKAESKGRIKDLRAQAENARQSARDYRRQASQARSDHAYARARGRPSSNLARATDYERKARAADKFAAKKEAEARALERKYR